MPDLTRSRTDGMHRETWSIRYGDIEIGVINERAGVPKDVEMRPSRLGSKARACSRMRRAALVLLRKDCSQIIRERTADTP
jgi:hypothetical protein